MRALRKTLFFFACVIAVLILAEVIMRIAYAPGREDALYDYKEPAREQLIRDWLDTGTHDQLQPPFLVYSDKDSTDPARLKMIFDSTRLPAPVTLTSSDFLLPGKDAASTVYTAHINSLGYRSPEYGAKKSPGTYRIIVLGSYHAFGFGVNDGDTYEAQLEKKLRADMPDKTFEVWNGGRYSGTAIDGLAQMKEGDVFEYEPDLIVLDYGFIDTMLLGDNVMPFVFRLPDAPLYRAARTALYPFSYLLSHSVLLDGAIAKLLTLERPARFQEFTTTMSAMMTLARTHHVPVMLVLEPKGVLALPPSVVGDAEAVINVSALIKQHPLPLPSDAERTSGYWARTWVSDLPRAELEAHPADLYFKNFLQVNSLAYGLIAEALAEEIEQGIKTP